MTLRINMRSASLAALLALGTSWSALAQDTTTENAEDAPAEQTAPSIEDELSLGEEATPAAPQPYIKETVGDWSLRCLQAQDGEERCQLYQLLSDSEGTPIAEFTLFRLPEGGRAQAGATIIVPLETALQQQMTITVDGGQARRYPYAFCNQIGCYARIGLTGEDISAFKRGNLAKLSISPFASPNEKVVVDLSLKGFTAAFDKASVVAQ